MARPPLTALRADDPGPRPVKSLVSRREPLASPARQLEILSDAAGSRALPAFDHAVQDGTGAALTRGALRVFQVNVGKLCNMTCRHCHVDAGPDRREMMDDATIDAVIAAMDRVGAGTVDITGGAPELHPRFRDLVDAAHTRGLHVIDRCNLTILNVPRFSDLPEWLGERGVEVVASLPHHARRSTDAQRGDGAFDRSIEAIGRLNAAGYGAGDPTRVLTLVMNPAGAFLAPDQRAAEPHWKRTLQRQHGVTFDRLIALNNMPIARFLEWLNARDLVGAYMGRLVDAFNPAAVDGVMCRDTVSVGWDGAVYDCDFNQMLALPVRAASGRLTVHDLAAGASLPEEIVTDRHCFGCTAGCGSSCAGATAS